MSFLATCRSLSPRLIWDLFDPSALGHYRRLARPVHGWLSRNEEAILFQLARAVPANQAIVELGAWLGRSSILLGGGSRTGHGAPVYSVDLFLENGPHHELLRQMIGDTGGDFLARFQANIRAAGLDGVVRAVRSDSAQLAAKWDGPPVGLLFVDAEHSYPSVMRDWTGWQPILRGGAVVAFHDYDNPDFEVTQAVNEIIRAGQLRRLGQSDSIVVCEVVHGPTAG